MCGARKSRSCRPARCAARRRTGEAVSSHPTAPGILPRLLFANENRVLIDVRHRAAVHNFELISHLGKKFRGIAQRISRVEIGPKRYNPAQSVKGTKSVIVSGGS